MGAARARQSGCAVKCLRKAANRACSLSSLIKPFHGGVPYIRIQPNGSRLWRPSYRYCGRQKTLHLGARPEVGIATARQQRDKAREQIAVGLDPATEKKRATLACKVAADNTFKTIAEEWVTKNEREGRAPVTLDKIRPPLKRNSDEPTPN